MTEPLFVATIGDFQALRVKVVRVGKTDVAVVFDRGIFYAFKDACPHGGHPLSRDRIIEGLLSCPGHNWQFELASGRCVKEDTSIALKRYDVLVQGDRVFVRDPAEESSAHH